MMVPKLVQYLAPQPLTDVSKALYKGIRSEEYKLSNENFRCAAKVLAYAFSRAALAGAAYYGINKFKPNMLRATAAGAVISAPTTALFWAGRLFTTGAAAVKTTWRTPKTRAFAIGLAQLLASLPLSGCYKGMGSKAGLFEWQIFPRIFGKLEKAGRGF